MPAVEEPAFELPPDTPEEDQVLLHNVLTAMQALQACRSYKVHVTQVGFLVRGALHADSFELDAADMHLIASVCPLRVERVAVARVQGRNEIVVKVLNARQRVMLEAVATCTTVKRRRVVVADAKAV